jgi:deoxyribodipyrimidine photo-lyase
MAKALVWFRRDLRLADNPALTAALRDGFQPVLVYVHAPHEQGHWAPGAANRTWLHHSLACLQRDVAQLGGNLLLLKGDSLAELERLQMASEAEALYFSNLYEPLLQARDARIQQAFEARGIAVHRSNAGLLIEPWQVQTGGGTPYKVFTPFWRNASAALIVPAAQAKPDKLSESDYPDQRLDSLGLLPDGNWHVPFWQFWQPGEQGALEMLEIFCEGALHGYKEQRNLPDRTGTSKLSPHLHFGEISVQQIWRRLNALHFGEAGQADIGHYRSELGWREFSNHLLHHFPHSSDESLNPRFADFAWADADAELLEKWQQGRTGVPIVDAGMRELWHTGWMHNRVRMIVASFLCKNLRYHWLHGARWFWDTLLDADLANNSQGWQWTAGTGCDAAPYFRIFNPVTQAERFDPQARYIKRWIPELAGLPPALAFAPWLKPEIAKQQAPHYPQTPILDLSISRQAALAAYSRN